MSSVLIAPASGAQILVFKHPHTNKAAPFAVGEKWVCELRSVTSQESVIHNGEVSSQPVLISVNINAVYLLLPVLFANKARPLPLSFLLEMLDQEADVDSMPAAFAESACRRICTCTTTDEELVVQLDVELLKKFLLNQVDKVSENCPETALKALYSSLGFLPSGPPLEDINARCRIYCAVQIIANSYLNQEIREFLLKQYNFDDLVAIARKNELMFQRLGNPQSGLTNQTDFGPKKRAAPAARKTTKKTVDVTNNYNLLDMFRKK